MIPRITPNGLVVITANGFKAVIDAKLDAFEADVRGRNPEDRRMVWEHLVEIHFAMSGAERRQYSDNAKAMGVTVEQSFRIACAYVTPAVAERVGR